MDPIIGMLKFINIPLFKTNNNLCTKMLLLDIIKINEPKENALINFEDDSFSLDEIKKLKIESL